jgi:hypothetical protein
MSSRSPRPYPMAAPPARRVLVVTNETLAAANEVPEPIRPLLDPAEDIYVIAPTLTTWLQWVASDVDGRAYRRTSGCVRSSSTCAPAA